MDLWAYHHKVEIAFNRPGKPTDNAFVDSFNGTLRNECLNVHWFTSLADAREQIERWRVEYNESRLTGLSVRCRLPNTSVSWACRPN